AKLNDGNRFKEFKEDVDSIECSKVRVDIAQGVKKVREIVDNNQESRITVHILSDFRQIDWESAKVDEAAKPKAPEGKEGEEAADNLHSMLVKMAQNRSDLKIRLIDTVSPVRQAGQWVQPISHENVGIVDFRAGTRIVGKDMPVPFTVTLANFTTREV